MPTVSVRLQPKEQARRKEICIKRFITKNWHTQLCSGGTSPVSIGSCQEGQFRNLGCELKLLPTDRIFSLPRKALTLLLCSSTV